MSAVEVKTELRGRGFGTQYVVATSPDDLYDDFCDFEIWETYRAEDGSTGRRRTAYFEASLGQLAQFVNAALASTREP